MYNNTTTYTSTTTTNNNNNNLVWWHSLIHMFRNATVQTWLTVMPWTTYPRHNEYVYNQSWYERFVQEIYLKWSRLTLTCDSKNLLISSWFQWKTFASVLDYLLTYVWPISWLTWTKFSLIRFFGRREKMTGTLGKHMSIEGLLVWDIRRTMLVIRFGDWEKNSGFGIVCRSLCWILFSLAWLYIYEQYFLLRFWAFFSSALSVKTHRNERCMFWFQQRWQILILIMIIIFFYNCEISFKREKRGRP